MTYDYGFRIYDARIAKFLSVDPLSPKYPWYTPYQFAGNKPIWALDIDGLEELPFTTHMLMGIAKGDPAFGIITYINDCYNSNKFKSKSEAFGRGLDRTIKNLAIIRPADKDEPQNLIEEWEAIKKMPANIINLPSHFKKLYEEGSTEDQIEETTALLGTFAGVLKGKAPSSLDVVQAAFKLPKLSIAFYDYFTKGVHAYAGKGEALYYLDESGQISVKAVGKNLSTKDINQIVKEGKNALGNESFREGMIKKIDDALGLPNASKFENGAGKLNDMKKAIENYGTSTAQ